MRPEEIVMPDDTTKTGRPDRDLINLSEPYEVRHWCDTFRCTEDELRAAVKSVGAGAKKVRAYFEARR